MEQHDVSLKLPAPLLSALRRIALDEDISVGQVIRDAVNRDLSRRHKTPEGIDPGMIAALRALLADDFAEASHWDDLQTRLRAKGYRVVEAGGGVALQDIATGQRLCKAADLGYGYAQLLRKFNAGFPGHAHQWLADRILSGPPH